MGFQVKPSIFRYNFRIKHLVLKLKPSASVPHERLFYTNGNDLTVWKLRHRSILKYAVFGFSSVVGYYLYHNKRNAFENRVWFPVIHAAVPLPSIKIEDDPHSARNQFNFIANIVEKNAPGLVCIEIKDTARLDYFSRTHPTMVNGSGFIIDENGLILTNAHVVMSHPRSVIQVRMSDGTTYVAKIEDIDVRSDLATLRVQPKKKLPIMKLGCSKNLRLGEWVIAMGSPLSLSNTITAGIVSAVGRTSSELGLHGRDMEYIQTDAAITFGNSGGPLVNLDGDVVGINSMKVSAGISFAIPIDYAKDFLQKTKSKQSEGAKAKGRRYLGITMLTLTSDIIEELQNRNHYIPSEVKNGVLIWKVVIGSPAHKSGLLPGDIIIEMNGEPLKSVNAVYQALEQLSVINLRVYRGNSYLETTVFPEDV